MRLFEQRVSTIEGSGCFAVALIAAGQVVERWTGARVSTSALRRIAGGGGSYSAVAIDEDEHLLISLVEPSDSGAELSDGAGGFNHSCDANPWMEDATTVSARRDIAVGEELTLDYALCSSDPAWRLAPCRCRSPLCRGSVTGEDWRLEELQRRYVGHFTAFLNERIARLPR